MAASRTACAVTPHTPATLTMRFPLARSNSAMAPAASFSTGSYSPIRRGQTQQAEMVTRRARHGGLAHRLRRHAAHAGHLDDAFPTGALELRDGASGKRI